MNTSQDPFGARGSPLSNQYSAYKTRHVFPFTALVGQDRMKLALALNAINPTLGGVLVRGEKGTAKSTAVRALAGLLPRIPVVQGCPYSCDPQIPDILCNFCQVRLAKREMLISVTRMVPVVDLPVGATEDRVVGTIDLEQAIQHGERRFEPGILAAANRGILYIDEVNLLSDHLVDVLLDAAAMGVNVVEREGISVSHPARFMLIGTMNPEEGDLRPQLLDRFALGVEVQGISDPSLRAEVVRRRIAFEADPPGFLARWAQAEAAEQARVVAAQELLPQVVLDEDMLTLITRLCAELQVDGLRGDIVMYKAACALAAYGGRIAVTDGDVRTAAELALTHRLRRGPFEHTQLDQEVLNRSIERLRSGEAESDESEEPEERSNGGGGAPDQVFQPGEPRPVGPLPATTERDAPFQQFGRRGPVTDAGPTGQYVYSAIPKPGEHIELALDATVRAAAPYQRRRRLEPRTSAPPSPGRLTPPTLPAGRAASDPLPAILIRPQDVRRKVRQGKAGGLVLFVVDSSGSMGAERRMEAAKGAILGMLMDAYQKRDQVGLIAFRGAGAQEVLPPTSSVDIAERRLAELPTGGRTPLAHGLRQGLETIRRTRAERNRTAPLLVLLSDGRANVPLNGSDPQDAARRAARELAIRGIQSLVIDSEGGRLRLGLACDLSREMGARYVHLDDLHAGALMRAVRSEPTRGSSHRRAR